MIYSLQKFEFYFYYNFKPDRLIALYDIIHVPTLSHINDDVAKI